MVELARDAESRERGDLSGDPSEEDQTQRWVPGESGKRMRPDATEPAEPIEELELVDVRPRRNTPPPPRRVMRPPPSPSEERVDLDAIVRSVSRSSLPATAVQPLPSPEAPYPPAAPYAPVTRRPAERGRPTWAAAIVLTSGALVIGASSAVGLTWAARTFDAADAPSANVKPEEPLVAETDPRDQYDERAASIADAPGLAAPREATPAAPAVLPAVAMPAGELSSSALTRHAHRRAARVGRAAASRAASVEASTVGEGAGAVPDRPSVAPAPTGLPARPSRADVDNALNAILPALRACAPGFGVVDLQLHFAPSGRVTTAQVSALRATPEQRSCIARAARAAHVPPFSESHLSVRYPARL